MAKIGIIGRGFVGGATEYGFSFKGDHQIMTYDKFKDSDELNDVVQNSEFIFLCVPTPTKAGKIDLSILRDVLDEITPQTNNTDKIIIIKSSVIPGTTRALAGDYPESNFCANPEFLRQKYANEDFINAERTVIGADNEPVRERVKNLYLEQFPNIPVYAVDSISAEITKYMANCLLATKVIYANELYDLCQSFDVDYDPIKEMVMKDSLIGSQLDVTEERGFGGICFPKDIVALINLFKQQGVDSSLLETVWEKNKKIRKVKDWEDNPYAIND